MGEPDVRIGGDEGPAVGAVAREVRLGELGTARQRGADP